MRVVIALGGNAILRRGESMTQENQRPSVQGAARAMGGAGARHRRQAVEQAVNINCNHPPPAKGRKSLDRMPLASR